MTRDEPPIVSKDVAKELVDEATYGFMVVARSEPIPAIGKVDPKEIKYNVRAQPVQFGNQDEIQ